MVTPLDLLIKSTGDSVAVINTSSRSGLNSGANFLRKKSREWIETEGQGSWPKKKNLSRKIKERRATGQWELTAGERRSEGALYSLRGLVRYTRVLGQGVEAQVEIGFGSKRKLLSIPQKFRKLALQVQERKSFSVTKKMQRKLTASKEAYPENVRKRVKAGKDYFAPKPGSSFERPQRDIFASVDKKFSKMAVDRYNRQFKRRFNREIRKRNIPFTPLK